jgi:hypothetical protein
MLTGALPRVLVLTPRFYGRGPEREPTGPEPATVRNDWTA